MTKAPPRPPFLVRRLIAGLVVLHAAVGLLLIFAQPLMQNRMPLRQWLATEQAKALLAEAIRRDAAGALVLQSTPALQAYLAATPGFWFFATDGNALLRGGASLNRGEPANDKSEWKEMQGAADEVRSRAGEIVVLMGGQQGALRDGVAAWLSRRLQRWLVFLVVIAALNTAAIVGLVHLLLRPVRTAAAAAAALQPGQTAPALPEAGVPAEILPLVSATNAAFARLEQANERQRRFIANAAHELRTPVAILGIRLDELPESETKRRLRQDVRRLTMLANQLLDLERLHHGGPPHDRLELVALARDVVAEMGPLAIENGSSLSFRSALPRLEMVGDEQALRGVLLNLVGNALAHGGPRATVSIEVTAEGAIEVADRGAGVPAEARERVFEPFQRAGGGAGAGLGLYIVREVLRAHGGTIELREGRPGAVFRLRFG
jgi:signal transduction histidine kinase